jgi:acyl-CoA dehydrogenase
MEPPDQALDELTRRVQAAVIVAGAHAKSVDIEARFPVESFAAIKSQRLLGIMLPSDLGGEGATISQVGDICYKLAQSCASTAMIFAMHQIKTACILRHKRGNLALTGLLRRLSAEQLLLASSTTEGHTGGNVRSSEAPVERQGDRIRLERRASVISYGAYADGIVTTARRSADAPASDQVLIAFLKSDYSLTRLNGWDTMGMRGTCSEGYTLLASGSVEQIVPDAYEVIHAQTMVPTAHLLWGSVWAGIASDATLRAQAFIRQAARQANGQLPPGAPQFTKVIASLRTLRAMLGNSMRVYERCMDDPKALSALEFQSMITLTKVEASELALSIVLAAMRVCGLSGYRRDGDFSIERCLRDVLSAPIMINNERILANLASTALVTPVPGSVLD